MKSHSILLTSVALALSILTAPLAFAQSEKPYKAPTVEEIFKSPLLSGVQMSRSGKYLAATAPHKGKRNIVIIDMESRKGSIITSYENFDVVGMHWVGDEKIVYSLGRANSPTGAGQFDGGGLFVVSRDGKSGRQLSATIKEQEGRNSAVYRFYNFVQTIPGDENEIIVSGNHLSEDSEDLYRMNLNTGRATIITAGRPASRTTQWMLDSKLVPRITTSFVKDEITRVVHYRAGEGAPWTELARFSLDKGDVFVPLAIESDDKTLQVATSAGRETIGIFRYDPAQKKLGEQIAAHPRFDMGANFDGERIRGLFFDYEANKILGYSVEGDQPETVWVDEERARLQKTLDNVLPGTINSWQRTPKGNRFVVRSYSDTQSLKWHVLDLDKKTLEEIGTSTPWLDGKLVKQRPMRFKTRDGLEIPGYYFLPPDYKPGTKLPTILHIHGGPSVRADTFGDGFGYLEGQLFASRGYAVIVPNFRSTPGFGKKIYQAGFGAFGRQMSEDHEDALKWAINEGLTDASRVCISGASYGGYAALQAMAKAPEMFKCAVAGLAVTDLDYQNTSTETDYTVEQGAVDFWKALLGVKSFSEQIVRDISPVNYANKIKGAVFLYAGQDDSRVPIDQINRMDKALKAAGNPAKAYVVKAKEGHGFGKLENNVDLYNQVLKFLDDNIGKK